MERFIDDLIKQLDSYYDQLVVLLPRIVIMLLLLVFVHFIGRRLKKVTTNYLLERMDDPLLARFLGRTLQAILNIIALLLALKIVGLGGIASGLLASAGVGAFVIGFAFKDIGENFLAGIMLAFSRPFRVGDTVELDGCKGTVLALNLRNVQIKTFDGKDVYIPNANIIKDPVVNYTIDGFLRLEVTIGIDYGASLEEATRIILETVKTVPGVLKEGKLPSIAISELAPSTLNLTVYFWIDTYDPEMSGMIIKNEVISRLLTALDGAGVYLPGNVMELKNYSDTGLRTGT